MLPEVAAQPLQNSGRIVLEDVARRFPLGGLPDHILILHRGEHEDWGLLEAMVTPECFQDLEDAHLGHLQMDNERVRNVMICKLERPLSVAGPDREMAQLCDDLRDHLKNQRRVNNNQDVLFRRRSQGHHCWTE